MGDMDWTGWRLFLTGPRPDYIKERDWEIVRRIWLGGPETYRRIGADYGITGSGVRQVSDRVIRRWRRREGQRPPLATHLT